MIPLRLWYVVPRTAFYDSRYRGVSYAEYLPDSSVSHAEVSQVSNAHYVRTRELSGPHSLSKCVIATPFAFPVCGVVLGSAQKEMVRVAARRVIALMQHMTAIWHRSACQFPGDAMRELRSAMVFLLAVARRIKTSCPAPAGILSAAAVNGVPEALVSYSLQLKTARLQTSPIVRLAQTTGKWMAVAAIRRAHFAGVCHVETLIQRMDASGNMRCAGTVTPSVTP